MYPTVYLALKFSFSPIFTSYISLSFYSTICSRITGYCFGWMCHALPKCPYFITDISTEINLCKCIGLIFLNPMLSYCMPSEKRSSLGSCCVARCVTYQSVMPDGSESVNCHAWLLDWVPTFRMSGWDIAFL